MAFGQYFMDLLMFVSYLTYKYVIQSYIYPYYTIC